MDESLIFQITEHRVILKMVRAYHEDVMAPCFPGDEAQKKFGERMDEIIKNSSPEGGLVTFRFDGRIKMEEKFVGIYYGLLRSIKVDFTDREARIAKVFDWDKPIEPATDNSRDQETVKKAPKPPQSTPANNSSMMYQ